MDYKKNNFDFLRLVAAAMVLLSHQRVLMGMPDIGLDKHFSLGSLGVCIFFIISGYLVTQSWQRDPNALRFLTRRFLRIWPGLFMVTCAAALIVGPIASSLDAKSYFSSPELHEYFRALRLTQMRLRLPGVFTLNPYPRIVNGSLWTIPLEVHWYLVLAIAGLLGILRWRWLALIVVASFAIYHFCTYHGDRNRWNEYGLFFLAGALLSLFRDRWAERSVALVTITLTIGALLFMSGWDVLGVLIAMPGLVIFTGEASTPFLRRFGRFGDLSYGIYIYAFMVQQTLIWKFGVSGSFAYHLLSAVVVTFICAWLSWHLVEKPALSFKPSRKRAGQENLQQADMEKTLA